ncbi:MULTISPECIES: NAD-dependent epimerase/dehydratase family protein [unclassified Mucilaginibacter]|uniref:NAD-dependent epimerase/dehydratase family protein n=1 Tax=unclassified Mucilaginibacter TaxID=2617802 RepID=UPI002AC9B1AF|nr:MULTISPECIES: NAD-dependent epimerase/dehydratase family protein [unclassified Mucilaginibacter]MEB0261298.1 NAD-dependent epimerase/dehydratase family protein [Mucilaginibacter sp. 10I4]MEB0280439.1 NAD-dependent epimerase/dehydratase family protein [Mucilaginibacter sp. 10B2]MEB0300451.1 NAD-dependent epimerase/dehydratase family protein [Mucilaginibacter sp. 5C4]WPX23114.1 NAD-dependent epimerase/dehydratase family protein [Mucilaginibacter sp. 5C4]
MHTILGAGGPVANALTNEFLKNHEPVRLVSRRPVDIQGNNLTWRKADLLDYKQVQEAAQGSTVIYLCAGLVYDADIWREQWPIVIQNVINVTKENNARLIFFDNVYMYGLVNGPMKEDTPYRPISEKGKVRAAIADTIMKEVNAGTLNATIARAPDFYGTTSTNAFLDMMVLSKYAKKQIAQWMGDPNKLHNFIYIPDAGRAMYLLGQHPESDNQIWHLPTAPVMKGQQFLELAARIYGVKPKFMRVRKFMLWILGLFDKLIAGTVEMYYQTDHDYIFNSDKFEKAFNFKPTSYEDGIKEVARTIYKPE